MVSVFAPGFASATFDLLRRGEVARACRTLEAALAGGYDPRDPHVAAVVLFAQQMAGPEAANRHIEPDEAFARALSLRDPSAASLLAGPYATFLQARARMHDAREVVDRALEHARGLDALHGVVISGAQFAGPALAERLLFALDELTAEEPAEVVRATRAHVTALIERSRGEGARAREAAATAQTAYARGGWLYYAALADELAGNIPAAGREFVRLGALADARRLERTLAGAPAPAANRLSSREDEVARLAAGGASNAQIAAKLHLSEKTVEKHLSAVYRKLGVTRRVELVTLLEGSGQRSAAQVRLPAPFGPFVGRDVELIELEARVQTYRLVTLSGAGGGGKTRTAIEYARRYADRFPDGVWFFDLSPLRDMRAVIPTMVGTIEIADMRGDARATLLAFLAQRRALLVLDNCEQLVPELGSVVRDILEHAPQTKVLATSRQRLGMLSECVVRLGPMQPRDAVAFFAERSSAAGVDAADTARVEAICKRVDCIPLAIELAAARLHDMPIHELEAALAGQSGVLRTEDPGLVRRHRSIDALIESGYALLDERTRAVFRRLAVFSAPFLAERVAEVSGGAVETELAVLHRMSLLERLPGGRYRMLQVVRDVALALLRVENEERDAFATFASVYRSMLEDAYQSWFALPIETWLAPLREETANIQSAIEWCFTSDGDVACGLGLTAIAARLWNELGREPELERILATALTHENEGRRADRVRLWIAKARYHDVANAFPEALAASEAGLALCDDETDERDAAMAVLAAGCSHAGLGDALAARPLLQQALELTRNLGIRRSVATALTALAIIAEEPETQIELFTQVLDLAKALENRLLESITLSNLAEVYGRGGDAALAIDYARRSVALMKELGAQTRLVRALLTLAYCEERPGQSAAARQTAATAFVQAAAIDHAMLCARAAALLTRALAVEHPALAAQCYGFSKATSTTEAAHSEQQAARIEEVLGRDAFREAMERGTASSASHLAAEVRIFAE